MMDKKFDTSLRDSQGTKVDPVSPERFDLEAYADYEEKQLEKNRIFLEKEEGLLVYRRVRADGVFYDRCRDYKESLALQLGALKLSMSYEADIANFLEPWYGIGYIASCFGGKYVWEPGQAPSVDPGFESAEDILNSDFIPIASTETGRHILEMTEYFMDQTRGKVPISLTDVQSPINMLTYLLPVTNLFYDVMDEPEQVQKAAELVSGLLMEFLLEQKKLLGSAMAGPGHGFASSRAFPGIGLSNDMSIMVRNEDYEKIFKKSDEKLGEAFGGGVYHSCGVWESKIDMVKRYRNIFMADGAFSIETDPSPNCPEVFAEGFAGSGIVLNARAVGDADHAFTVFEKLWKPKQKLICVTYCKSPEEQKKLYEKLHRMEEKR